MTVVRAQETRERKEPQARTPGPELRVQNRTPADLPSADLFPAAVMPLEVVASDTASGTGGLVLLADLAEGAARGEGRAKALLPAKMRFWEFSAR